MFKEKVQRLRPDATATKTAHGWDVRAGADILGQGGSAAAAWMDAALSCFPGPSAAAPLPPEPGAKPVEVARPERVPMPTWPFPSSTRPELQAQHDTYRAALGSVGATSETRATKPR